MKMNKNKNQIQLTFILAGLLTVIPFSAQAIERITRPYQSVHSAGMGGVKLTTGFYDENFYGNQGQFIVLQQKGD